MALLLSLLSVPAQAAEGDYSSPSWFPLRGSHLVGCTYLGAGAPCNGTYHGYWALDIKGNKGDDVFAAGAGQVVTVVKGQDGNCNADKPGASPSACPNGSRGNSVLIDHGSGVFSYYQHLSAVSVNQGAWVDETIQIGDMGDSGFSSPGFYHLHYERRQGTKASYSQVDPGPLKGCVSGTLKTYPQDLTPAGAGNSWQGLPTQKFTAASDGTTCTRAPAPGGGGGRPRADLVFVIDTTGSMSPYISAVTASARVISDRLFGTADARVALVEYKDLYASCAGDGYASRVDLPFTTNGAAFGPAVGALRADGGCDFAESVYSGIMTAIAQPWRPGAKRAVLVMGDAPPHDPEPVSGYTLASVIAAARAGGVAVTATGARTTVDASVATAETTDPIALYSINIGGGGSPYFDDLAAGTGGRTYLSDDPASAVEDIISAITEITDSAVVADAGGPYTGVVGEPVTFDASNSTGGDAGLARYDWDFDGDGTYDETTTLPTVSHQYAAPYTGTVGLRVATAGSPEQSATATAEVTILSGAKIRYAGQRSGRSGQSVVAQAFVTDDQGRGIGNATVVFTLGSASCTAQSDANGKATCTLRVPTGSARGRYVVSAESAPERYFPVAVGVAFTV